MGPISRVEARAEVEKWDRAHTEDARVRKQVREKHSCIAKMFDGMGYSICEKTDGVVMTSVGPLCREHAADIKKKEDKSCIARKHDGSICGRTERVEMTPLGPMCYEHTAKGKKDEEETCIARGKDGSICDKSDQVKIMLLGPLCREHAAMCKIQEADNVQVDRSREPKATTKSKSVSEPVASLEVDREGTMSPGEGIVLSSMRESLQ